MKKKNGFIAFWKANLFENLTCLFSLVVLFLSSGLIWGLIETAFLVLVERIISNFSGKKKIGLIVQIILTVLIACFKFYIAFLILN